MGIYSKPVSFPVIKISAFSNPHKNKLFGDGSQEEGGGKTMGRLHIHALAQQDFYRFLKFFRTGNAANITADVLNNPV